MFGLLVNFVNYISPFKLFMDCGSTEVRHSLTIEFAEERYILLEVHSEEERLVSAAVSMF